MKVPYHFLVLLIGCLLFSMAQAQQDDQRTVRGVVRDSLTHEALIGVNIYLKDHLLGTVSDQNGEYELRIPDIKGYLVFSYIGYKQKNIHLNPGNDLSINVFLETEHSVIHEVQITAQRKFFGNMDYGREISSIGAELIEKQNINNASDILHARIPGVWATKTSGAPGDHQKIRVRGQTSFFTSAEPLYVVDGVPVPIVNLASLGIADLNIHDIENITVLKDASSTALYGFQGGNGVVLIDTKQGGEPHIDFTLRSGYQWFNNFYDFLSSEEQIHILDKAYDEMRFIMHFYYPEITDTLCNRDWQDYIFDPGNLQEYQLSASGKKNKLNYYFSGNYTDHKGIIPQSSYKRYTFSSRVGRKSEHLALGLAYRASYQQNIDNQDEYLGNRIIWEGITKSPSLECTHDSLIFAEMGTVNLRALNYYIPLKKKELPQQLLDSNFHQLNILTNAISGFGRIQFNDHLSMDVMESLLIRNANYNAKFDYYYLSYINYGSQLGFAMESNEDVALFNHQVNISYYNGWGDHNINLVLAHRFYKDNLWWQIDTLKGTLDDNFSLKNSMAGYGPSGSVLRNMNSYIAHASYNFREKYFLSLIANYSQVKEGVFTNYYHFFPSVAASWDLSEENFLKDLPWLSELKVFGNWGISGNYPLNGLANDLYTNVVYPVDGVPIIYKAIHQLANHDLRHENTNEIDIGIKSEFLNRRLQFNASWFNKRITDLIIQRDIPIYYGGGKMFMNLAEIDVRGFEISLETIPVQTRNFVWLLAANYSQSYQWVRKLDKEKSIRYDDPDILIPEFLITEGEGLGDIYGYQYLGKWTAADDADTSDLYVELKGSKFLNADTSDSELTQFDKISLGNALPDFTCNFSTSLQYKNLGMDMRWYAAIGQEKYNATHAAAVMAAVHPDVVDYINDTLRVLGEDAFYESNVFVEDASFVRLKTLSFWYTPKAKIMKKGEFTFTISFENLLTLTRYEGFDPEATIFTDNNFSDNSIDRGAYPNPKAVYFSVNLSF
ncbi:MAG: SusC/RagA family TonB-linked outer membrane protein [Bacteroidales bacterium]|nr:SusC/RagA family TonB-linked outer membrane protein [Bacteroidales bacterium]